MSQAHYFDAPTDRCYHNTPCRICSKTRRHANHAEGPARIALLAEIFAELEALKATQPEEEATMRSRRLHRMAELEAMKTCLLEERGNTPLTYQAVPPLQPNR